jgi:hypothetical protein
VAMPGSLYPIGNPTEWASPHTYLMFIFRVVFLEQERKHLLPIPIPDERWIHWGSDIFQCYQLLSSGFVLYNVDTVNSVWRKGVSSPERWNMYMTILKDSMGYENAEIIQ